MQLARPLVLTLCAAALLQASLSPDEKLLTEAMTAAELRAHVSFLASDPLEGRDTPSRGLDVAAEYIASEFRRAGLEPAGDDGYFQTAPHAALRENLAGFHLALERDGKTLAVPTTAVRVTAETALDLKDVPLVRVPVDGDSSTLAPGSFDGKAVLTETPDFSSLPAAQRAEAIQQMLRLRARLRESNAALLIEMTNRLTPARPRLTGLGGRRRTPPAIEIDDPALRAAAATLPPGLIGARISLRLAAPEAETVRLKNVAGLVRGSDPQLKDTYVIVSGHYDHEGVRDGVVYNGANDDASGTSAMLAIAEAVARLPQKPKRSILFIAYFGEEKGLLGSRYYGAHPLFPLSRTVANLNLEQMGRTDDSDGPNRKSVFVTGFDYTNLKDWLANAGRETGVRFGKDGTNSDAFFARSDNQSLADAGVPAHTLVTAYMYPDYHQPGDHWEKIDYDNMATVTRAIGVALLRVANSSKPVEWNASNPKAASYVEAARELVSGK